MKYLTFIKECNVNSELVASGDGYWGMKEGTKGKVSKVSIVAMAKDGKVSSFAEVKFYHDKLAKDHGLFYTDSLADVCASGIFKELKVSKLFLVDNISGSEQGMQGENYLSCDADFKQDTTVEDLIRNGFKMKV